MDPLVAQQCAERLQLKDLRQCSPLPPPSTWVIIGGEVRRDGMGCLVLGSTETLAVTCGFYGCTKIDSVGMPLPGVVIKVAHVDKRFTVNYGETGELCIKGPQVTLWEG